MRNLETILITGGAGFIGSNLCEFYLNKGVRVICLDNLLTGNEANIEWLRKKSNFTFVKGDIRDFSTCAELSKKCSAVSHQAALGSVPRSIENPLPTNEINCHGFLNMLTAAKENGVRRFVYASSSSVYGDSAASPKKEDQLGKPLSPYAVSKLTNELYGKIFFDLYGMETIGLRYFNVFGNRQDPNGAYAAAIPKFIERMKAGGAPIIYGDGKQTRDFTYIKNVLHANELALETTNSKCFGEAFNVACGKSYNLNEVVDIIKRELIKKGYAIESMQPTYTDSRVGDILNSLADISKISTELGYSVSHHFEQGIAAYISDLNS